MPRAVDVVSHVGGFCIGMFEGPGASWEQREHTTQMSYRRLSQNVWPPSFVDNHSFIDNRQSHEIVAKHENHQSLAAAKKLQFTCSMSMEMESALRLIRTSDGDSKLCGNPLSMRVSKKSRPPARELVADVQG